MPDPKDTTPALVARNLQEWFEQLDPGDQRLVVYRTYCLETHGTRKEWAYNVRVWEKSLTFQALRQIAGIRVNVEVATKKDTALTAAQEWWDALPISHQALVEGFYRERVQDQSSATSWRILIDVLGPVDFIAADMTLDGLPVRVRDVQGTTVSPAPRDESKNTAVVQPT